jgi:putative transcriptional regulator
MSDGKPRKSADPLYLLLREGNCEQFNRRRKAGETCDLPTQPCTRRDRNVGTSRHSDALQLIRREAIGSTGRYDPSLPLAFAIAKLFRRRIEEIFYP